MIKDIIKGTFNNIMGLQEELSLKRLKICYKCPLYSKRMGGICNHKLWINPETEEVSIKKIDGYKKGCGCVLESKTRVPKAKCIINKW